MRSIIGDLKKIVSRRSMVDGVFDTSDRHSLTYTNGYVRDFTEHLAWRKSYELLDRLLLIKWHMESSRDVRWACTRGGVTARRMLRTSKWISS